MSVFKEKNLEDIVTLTKGTELYNLMLLSQYKDSPNLKAYAGAFLSEFDMLFEQTERVYLGRFLEYATGHQLSLLGETVGISRELTLDSRNFGFEGEVGEIWADTFGTVGNASTGGVFATADPTVVQLSDTVFRRAVRAKAFCNSSQVQSVDFMYKAIAMMLGSIPSVLKLEADHDIEHLQHFGFLGAFTSDTFGTLSDADVGSVVYSLGRSWEYRSEYNRRIILTLEYDKVDLESLNLIKAMKPFFVPAGYQFVFNLL